MTGGVEMPMCDCGCAQDPWIAKAYPQKVESLREEVSEIVARVAERRGRISHDSREAAHSAALWLDEVGDELMARADREPCARRASVFAMATACLTELAGRAGRGRWNGA